MDIRKGPARAPGTAGTDRQDGFAVERNLPLPLEGAIEEYITKKAGGSWDDPATLGKLRRAIVAQKDDYWRPAQKKAIRYAKGYSVLAYLAYHFPVYFVQAKHLLAMLARDGLLKPSMNILDIGTGPGVFPLAVADFYAKACPGKAAVYSIERSEEHREAFLFLRERCTTKGAAASIKPPIAMDILNPDPEKVPGKIDLMVFSNVLNELPGGNPESASRIVAYFAERLAPDGSILVTEPADEENATRMRLISASLARQGLSLFSPCSFLWGTKCNAPRCWSFESAPPIRLTRLMEALAQDTEGFRYANTDIKYSYAVLRKDGRTKQECRLPPGAKYLRLSKLPLHVGKRISVAAAKMSGELGNSSSHVIKLCDGTAKVPVYAVLPSYHLTPENRLITEAQYGTILGLRGVLVRYNKEHDAFNLLVNRNTTVERPGA